MSWQNDYQSGFDKEKIKSTTDIGIRFVSAFDGGARC
jgi:hypothetical protein